MPPREVTVTYLELQSPGELLPKRSSRPDLVLAQAVTPQPELNRFFYTAIGGDWHWNDRLPWTRQRWREYLDRPELETWVLSVAGLPAGYFELEQQAEGNVEVAYFGLLAPYTGQGLGGHLLTAAAERAWERGARRVWLHTCTLDDPRALPHYQARGFRIFDRKTFLRDLPLAPPGPWPEAGT